jgi:hypothetical protein
MIGKIKEARNLLATLDELGIVKIGKGDPQIPTKFEEGLKIPQNSPTFLSCTQYKELNEIVLEQKRYRRSLPLGSIEPQPLKFDKSCKPF